jgi:tRNA-(ms[2]io[6]A)-hydroxylase
MLGLKLPTDPRWVDIANKQIDEILTDHAYCEQKAASSCISLIILHSDKVELVDTLTPIVSEEWGHFRMVLKELKQRGFQLGKPRNDTYVQELLKLQQKDGDALGRLMDKLLVNALIEARSCERFRLLSEQIADDQLKSFYFELMKSEAGHYTTFLELAKVYAPEDRVKKRFEYFLNEEAKIMQRIEIRGDRMH